MREVEFHAPVFLGDIVSFYTETLRVGRTSITVKVLVEVERWSGGQGERDQGDRSRGGAGRGRAATGMPTADPARVDDDRRVRSGTVSNVGCGFDVLGFALEAPGDVVTARRPTARRRDRGDRGRRRAAVARSRGATPPASPSQALLERLGARRAASG